jgi:hypothetical protein
MLNANLAFLAIQNVDVNENSDRSSAQIFSYLSVIANIGSIVLGLLLMRHNRMETQTDDIVSHSHLYPFLFTNTRKREGFFNPVIIHN